MKKAVLFTFLVTSLCLTGCVTQDRLDAAHLDALGHPVRPTFVGDIHGLYESDLRRLLARRAQKDQVFKKFGGKKEHVTSESYWNKFYLTDDEQSTNFPPATREEWKRNFRLSTETYVAYGEDGNIMILYFDGSGCLWQYEHI